MNSRIVKKYPTNEEITMGLGFEGKLYGHFILQLEHLTGAPDGLDVLALPFRGMPPLPLGSVIEWLAPDNRPIELTVELYMYVGGLEVLTQWRDNDAVLSLLNAVPTLHTPAVTCGRRLIVPQEYCLKFAC